MKLIHIFICCIFVFLFHGKMLGESILAFQDASIKEGTTINGNWSKNEVYGNPDNPIVALVEFDISHLSGEQTLVSAIFRPYVRTLKDSKSSTFSIYSTGSQNWLQDSVTWNTRPTRGALLDSISINEKAVRVDFNVTQALQDAISDGKNKITFWIEDSEKESESFEFDSVNKNPSYPNEPELVLYTDSENTSTGTGQQESKNNPSGDLTAPIFSHAEISTSGNQVILYYNESLSNNVATTNDFSVVADATAIEVNSVTTAGSTIVLSLTSKIDWDQEVTIAYTNSASNNNTNSIQDYAGNLAGNLSNTSVLNKSTQGIPDTTHPTIFISSDAKFLYKNQTATINFALSETSTNFDQSDVDIKGGTLTNWTKLTQSSYTATFTPTTNSMSTGVISVAENKFTDEAGNTNLVGDKETNILVLNINTIQNVHNELRILGTAEDRSGVRGVLYADIYGITDLDPSKSFSYQWLSNDTIIEGATSQTLDVGDYFSFIENKEVVVSLSYTTSAGQETSISSAPMPYEGFRIVANAENDRNEWLDYTVSEVVPNAVNPYPLKESYSNNGTSSTSGTKSGSAHNIKAVNAADEGITARNGTNVIRIFADGSKSNRSELAHLNNETSFHPGEDYYFSGSFYPPKTEWDPVTEYSTVITQLKQYGGGDPNFELRLSNLGDYKMTWRGKPHGISYTDMGFAIPDEWNDLKIYAKHSQDSEGKFKVWLNNELVIDYTGPTMYRNAEGYLKFGMYTQIHDQRILYWDAIDISDHISTDFNTWLTSVSNKPSVNLNNNIDGQQFTDSKLLVISGSAIDISGDQIGSAGGISSVKLFAGDELLDSVTESEFSFSNLNLADGEHNLRIVVTDNDNNTREESFSIWIGNKSAQVFIISNDYLIGSFQTGSTVNLSANAYDEDGSIHEVKFFANGQLIGVGETISEGRFSLNWVPADAGSYAIQAQATDNDGAVTISDSVAALVGDNTMTTYTLQAIQDVTIEEGSSTTGNWSKTEVYGSPSKAKIALVEFDLSRIESSKYIRSAIFKPYITKLQNSPGTFSIYLANSKVWSQSKVNWNNRPSKEGYLDTITINSTGTRIGFDVTAGLQKAKDSGQSKVTFWIEDSEKEYQRFDFASHDNDSISQPAELIVESGSISLPQAIEGSYSENQDNEDDLPPTVSISTDTTALRKGEIANLSFSLSKKSIDFTPSDIFVSGGTLSNFSGSGLFYSAEFIPGNDHKAEMIISVGSSKFSDANGNYNEDGTDSNNKVSILFDATTPDTTNETMSTTLIATQDASIKKGTDTNGNWGDIEIYGHPTNPIIALVEFDLSNLNDIAEVGTAFFRPYIQNIKDGSGSFDIYTTGTENWNETVVTWSTRPSKGVLLDSITINATGKRFDFDVTKSVQNAVLKDQKKITFWIEDSQQSYERTDFDSSRSDQAYPPELIVKGRSNQSVAFDDGFTEGNNTGVQNVIENPQRYNLFTEQDINSILERERSIYKLKARKEGEDAVLQNPALYGLKSLDYAGKASPYTLEWFYEENLGWVYTNNSIFPYFFKSKKANEPSAWLYFDNGSYPPRFYNYNTEEWFELKE